MLVYIVGEVNDGQVRQMGGFSSLSYVFKWNNAHGRYTCEVTNQTDLDDLLKVNWACPSFPWRFGVIFEQTTSAQTAASRPVVAPYIDAKHYKDYLIPDLLAVAADCGITIQGDISSPDNIKRQIDAYCVGRGWSSKEMAALRDEVKALREAAAVLPSAPPPETVAPTPAKPSLPPLRRPGRKPAIDVRTLAVA